MTTIKQSQNALQIGDKIVHADGTSVTVDETNKDTLPDSLQDGDILMTLSGKHEGTVAKYKGNGDEEILIDGDDKNDIGSGHLTTETTDDSALELESAANYESFWSRIFGGVTKEQKAKLEGTVNEVEKNLFPGVTPGSAAGATTGTTAPAGVTSSPNSTSGPIDTVEEASAQIANDKSLWPDNEKDKLYSRQQLVDAAKTADPKTQEAIKWLLADSNKNQYDWVESIIPGKGKDGMVSRWDLQLAAGIYQGDKIAKPTAEQTTAPGGTTAAPDGTTAAPAAAPDGTTAAPTAAPDGTTASPTVAPDGTTAAPTVAPDGTTSAPTVAPNGTTAAPTSPPDAAAADYAAFKTKFQSGAHTWDELVTFSKSGAAGSAAAAAMVADLNGRARLTGSATGTSFDGDAMKKFSNATVDEAKLRGIGSEKDAWNKRPIYDPRFFYANGETTLEFESALAAATGDAKRTKELMDAKAAGLAAKKIPTAPKLTGDATDPSTIKASADLPTAVKDLKDSPMFADGKTGSQAALEEIVKPGSKATKEQIAAAKYLLENKNKSPVVFLFSDTKKTFTRDELVKMGEAAKPLTIDSVAVTLKDSPTFFEKGGVADDNLLNLIAGYPAGDWTGRTQPSLPEVAAAQWLIKNPEAKALVTDGGGVSQQKLKDLTATNSQTPILVAGTVAASPIFFDANKKSSAHRVDLIAAYPAVDATEWGATFGATARPTIAEINAAKWLKDPANDEARKTMSDGDGNLDLTKAQAAAAPGEVSIPDAKTAAAQFTTAPNALFDDGGIANGAELQMVAEYSPGSATWGSRMPTPTPAQISAAKWLLKPENASTLNAITVKGFIDLKAMQGVATDTFVPQSREHAARIFAGCDADGVWTTDTSKGERNGHVYSNIDILIAMKDGKIAGATKEEIAAAKYLYDNNWNELDDDIYNYYHSDGALSKGKMEGDGANG